MPTKEEIERLFGAGDAAALEAIAKSAPKAEAKEARRALHRLASRGVRVPDLPPSGERAYRPVQTDFEVECHLAAPDSEGVALVAVARAGRAGGIELVHAGMTSRQGFAFASGQVVGRKAYHEFIAADRGLNHGLLLRRVAREVATSLLGQARRRTEAAGRVIPRAVASLPAEWFVPLVSERSASDADPPASTTDVLFAEPEFRTWLPSRGFLERVAMRLEEADTSRLFIDDAQKSERLEAVLAGATEEFFNAETRIDYAWRLDVATQIFDATRRSAAALMARVAAAHLADQRLGLEGCGFTRAFVRRLFTITSGADAAEPGTDRNEHAPRLIVTPDEFAREVSKKR